MSGPNSINSGDTPIRKVADVPTTGSTNRSNEVTNAETKPKSPVQNAVESLVLARRDTSPEVRRRMQEILLGVNPEQGRNLDKEA